MIIKHAVKFIYSALINHKESELRLFTIFIEIERHRDGSYQPRVKRFSYRKVAVVFGEIVVIITNIQILCIVLVIWKCECTGMSTAYTRSVVSTTVNLLSNTYFELMVVVALLTDSTGAPPNNMI